MKIRDALDKAGVAYHEETFLSGFWGTRFIFPTLRDVKKAEKVLPANCHIMAYYRQWALEIYC